MTNNDGFSSYSELIERAKNKDKDAFLDLYHLTYATQFHIALAFLQNEYLAEDAVQEAYLNAWKDLGSLRDTEKFKPWLSSITKRMAIRIGRRIQKQNTISEPFFEEAFDEEPFDLSELVVKRELFEELHKSMELLPARQKRALEERYFSFRTNKEIAELMDCTEHDVKYYLRSGKKKLAHLLNKYYKGDERLLSWVFVPFIPSTAKKLSTDIKMTTAAAKPRVSPVHIAAASVAVATIGLAAFGITQSWPTDSDSKPATGTSVSDYSNSDKDTAPPVIAAYHYKDEVLTLIMEDNDSGVDYSQIYATLPDGARLEPDTVLESDNQVSFRSDTYPLQIHCTDRSGNAALYACSPSE